MEQWTANHQVMVGRSQIDPAGPNLLSIDRILDRERSASSEDSGQLPGPLGRSMLNDQYRSGKVRG